MLIKTKFTWGTCGNIKHPFNTVWVNLMEVLLNRIVKEAFPELLSIQFSLEYEELDNSFAVTWETGDTSYILTLDNRLKEAGEDIITGILAHELSHITQDMGLSRLDRWIDGFLCNHSPRYSLLDERNADLTVVLRGYGLNLLEFLRFIQKEYPDYETEGLSLNEVEVLIGKSFKS